MAESTETTAQQIVKTPDKVIGLFAGVTILLISLAVPTAIIMTNQVTLQANDARASEINLQQSLDINTLTVKLDNVIDQMRSRPE